MSAFNPDEAVENVYKFKITYMFAVPQLYFSMWQASNYSPRKMQSTQLVLYGGAQIDGEFLKIIDKEWAAVIRHIYGTTETMCSLYNPQPVGQHTRLRPGYYSRIRVIGLNGGIDDHVNPGEEGELIVDATVDTVFTEYLNRPSETANSVREGWYYTGDLCVYCDDGDVELIGRVDDLIRSGGESIHPGEIEEVLITNSAIKEVAVIGISHNKWGEAVTACIVGEKLTIQELEKIFRNSDIAQFKRPRIYAFLEKLPRNATNKIIRRELKFMVEKF
jgi:2-furoate---CoA ligase